MVKIININQVAKDLFCEYNTLLLLIKKYKVPYTFDEVTKDVHISTDTYKSLILEQDKFKNKLLPFTELLKLRSELIPINQQYYIYFLFKNEELIYIGQSCVLISRIGAHQSYRKKNKKDFNFISSIQVSSKKVLALEAFYIDKYKPRHNIVHNESNKLINYIFESIKI